jgi:hypothetical protein
MTRRISTILAAFAVGVSASAGATVAATGAPVDASRAVQGTVRIRLAGYLSGPQFAAVGQGRFTMRGAVRDHGTFVDRFDGIHPPNEPYGRVLTGGKGTIRVTGPDAQGPWKIHDGTSAYVGLRGRGRVVGRYSYGSGIHITMIGTLVKR